MVHVHESLPGHQQAVEEVRPHCESEERRVCERPVSRQKEEHRPDEIDDEQHGRNVTWLIAARYAVPDRPVQRSLWLVGQEWRLDSKSDHEESEYDERQNAVHAQERG